jgi:hypothetical protein
MSIVNIKIESQTETRLNHIRAELGSVAPSATFDETLCGLIELAEDHPEADFSVPSHVKDSDGNDI